MDSEKEKNKLQLVLQSGQLQAPYSSNVGVFPHTNSTMEREWESAR